MTRIAVLVVALFVLAAPGPPAVTAAREPLTLDWIFSEEGKTAATVPNHVWLDSGIAVLYDRYLPEGERTLESFDPVTGTRGPLIDRAAAVASLNTLAKPEEPIEEPGWPDAFNPRGGQACYVRDGDLYLLNFAGSTFIRATSTEAEEKSPRYSPDGRKLAFVRGSDLWVRDLAQGTETQLTHDGSDTLLNGTLSWVYWEEIFGRNDLGFFWAPDSGAIAYLQTDESPVGVMHFVDVDPALPGVIRQRYPKTGSANPRVRAGVVSVAGGETTWIDLGVYPYEYLARVVWLPGGGQLAVTTMSREQDRVDLFLADRASGRVEHLLRETDPRWVNLHDDLRFLADGRFLWVSERSGFAHLYLYSAGGAGEPVPVTRGEWALRSSGGVFWLSQAVAAVDEKAGWVWFTSLQGSSIERQLHRVRLDGSGLERISRGDGTHRILFSPDGRHYLDTYSSIGEPPSLALHDAAGKRLNTLTPSRTERLAPFALQTPELLTVPARDGFPMPARVLRPRGFVKNKRYPVVVYVYGGPSAPVVANAFGGGARDLHEQMLADAGYVVFRVDNRSATAASKTLENTYSGYGTAELDDLVDAVRWLKAQPFVDPERVGVWGWSGGGSFTLLALTGSTEFRAGVAVAAVSDWDLYDTKWAEAFMKTPRGNPDGYASTSHVDRAAKLHGRLMLVHGTYDDNVHPQNAWRFANALIEAGITFDMMIYPMRKHGIADDEAQKHLYRTLLEFWDRNL